MFALKFSEEAFDSAAAAARRIEGWTVTVRSPDMAPFDAEMGPVSVRDSDGEYVATLYPWSNALGTGDRSGAVVLPLYPLTLEVV